MVAANSGVVELIHPSIHRLDLSSSFFQREIYIFFHYIRKKRNRKEKKNNIDIYCYRGKKEVG
jgi:hypothetical protein